MPQIIIRLENCFIALIFLLSYFQYESNIGWVWFILLILAPDLSMLAYFVNPRVGATIYNLVHNYLLVLVLIIASVFVQDGQILMNIGWILAIHIGFDRALGLGLKYPTSFKPTHLQRI